MKIWNVWLLGCPDVCGEDTVSVKLREVDTIDCVVYMTSFVGSMKIGMADIGAGYTSKS